ncbi:hypothetical protein FJZ31_22005 [Candidatus Poribacteria bacterium]|nr:hypothetical protein [Candidatus Poribacteria bacterium]
MNKRENSKIELKRKLQEEKVKRTTKRPSIKIYILLIVLIILFYCLGWQRILKLGPGESILYGMAGCVSGILCAIWVYSGRLEKMVEERTKELREAHEQLVRQEKLAVLGKLAGGVSHELRNPLGIIKNAAYFLNMVLKEPNPEVKKIVEILEKEVTRSEGIISSLLDFARPKPPIWQQVDINELIRDALSRITVPENVEVVSQSDEALPNILADPGQLGQVFGNIILNAIQAMSGGGRLVIKSEIQSPQWVAISFADTGMGIPEENMGKIFEPFFTSKAKGIGLGLVIAGALVEGHGGKIEVQSEVGKGSIFTVRIPNLEKV